ITEGENVARKNRILKLFGIELPIIQAPMASCVFSEMVVAVSEVGGLGWLPCALLSLEQMRSELGAIRRQTGRQVRGNFYCHHPPRADANREKVWRQRLQRYYVEFGLEQNMPVPSANRAPFDDEMCDLVVEFHPEVVSFHFGLPEQKMIRRVRDTGAKIVSSATSVDEAGWLEDQGCDAIVAQGYEAGGHRGTFLSEDVSTQSGTMALVPQIVDAVKVPVIAAGGIADARGIVAAFALGAAAVQIGTAYLPCPELKVHPVNRMALKNTTNSQTTLTNIFTCRPRRAIVNLALR